MSVLVMSVSLEMCESQSHCESIRADPPPPPSLLTCNALAWWEESKEKNERMQCRGHLFLHDPLTLPLLTSGYFFFYYLLLLTSSDFFLFLSLSSYSLSLSLSPLARSLSLSLSSSFTSASSFLPLCVFYSEYDRMQREERVKVM